LGSNHCKYNIRALKRVSDVITIIEAWDDGVDVHEYVIAAIVLFEPIKNSANYPFRIFSTIRDDDVWHRGPWKRG
jgi:hypothetical protein